MLRIEEEMERIRNEERRTLLEDLGSYWAEMVASCQKDERNKKGQHSENSRDFGNPCQDFDAWVMKEKSAGTWSFFLGAL